MKNFSKRIAGIMKSFAADKVVKGREAFDKIHSLIKEYLGPYKNDGTPDYDDTGVFLEFDERHDRGELCVEKAWFRVEAEWSEGRDGTYDDPPEDPELENVEIDCVDDDMIGDECDAIWDALKDIGVEPVAYEDDFDPADLADGETSAAGTVYFYLRIVNDAKFRNFMGMRIGEMEREVLTGNRSVLDKKGSSGMRIGEMERKVLGE